MPNQRPSFCVTQLPAERELWTMGEADIQGRKDDIAKAITQYEDHFKRDHANMQLLREQITLMAHLNWEQQVHHGNFTSTPPKKCVSVKGCAFLKSRKYFTLKTRSFCFGAFSGNLRGI